MEKIIDIEGMGCMNCVHHVEEGLKTVPGVHSVKVDLAAKNAAVCAADGVADETLKAAVEEAGYEVTAIHEAK